MTRYSLRWRLLVGAAVAVFAALALAWLAMTLLFQRHLELRVEQELRRDALQLVAGLTVDPGADHEPQRRPTPDCRFPAGGLYWQVAPGPTQRSRSLWDRARLLAQGRHPTGATRRPMARSASDCSHVERIVRLRRFDGARAACAQRGRVSVARTRIQSDARFLSPALGRARGAAWIQVQLGLKPLKRLRRELSALRHHPERLSAGYPGKSSR